MTAGGERYQDMTRPLADDAEQQRLQGLRANSTAPASDG
jgi:hypothetical protein